MSEEPLVTCIASIGKNAVLRVKGACNQQINALIPKSDNNADYWYYVFEFSKEVLLGKAGQTATSIVSKATFEKLLFAAPTVREQRTIATALSDVDGLIDALDKLIAKKRAIKKAAMQQLLTGRTRLPGFSGAWETKRLGDIGFFAKGAGVTRDSAQSGALACVRYGELYTVHHIYIRRFFSRISESVAKTATALRNGDILFAGSGETKEEIGKCAVFLGGEVAYAGGDIVILRPQGEFSPLFLGYALNSAEVNTQKSGFAQGDAVVHISANSLAKIELRVPLIEEQTAIATVLSDMDTEIDALEQRRAKTRELKTGMMQQLLTGRIRLVQPEAQPAESAT